MKNVNGFGSVYKMSGNRRKPWAAVVTKGFEYDPIKGRAVQKKKMIGAFATKKEALSALIAFNDNAFSLESYELTFSDMYNRWSAQAYPKLSDSAKVNYINAYKQLVSLYGMRFNSIDVTRLECVFSELAPSTAHFAKLLCSQLYEYAIKYQLASVNYAKRCQIKPMQKKIKRVPFIPEEIDKLFDLKGNDTIYDMVLVGIFSGWRPSELIGIKLDDINLDAGYITGGMKTVAGKGRVVPIHSAIYDIISEYYQRSLRHNLANLFVNRHYNSLSYKYYRFLFMTAMSKLGFEHTPHDTRHTFITLGKACGMDEYVLKTIVGHSIADITESVYTHRTFENLKTEIEKIDLDAIR